MTSMADVRYDSYEKIEVLFDQLHKNNPTSPEFKNILKRINRLSKNISERDYNSLKFSKYQEHLEKAGQLNMFR